MELDKERLEYLFDHYWVLKEREPEEYFKIKNSLDDYKDFIQSKLGSKLIVNNNFIKLEKIPAITKSYMGISEFNSTLEYVILFLILLFLEDKPKDSQFILSNLVDFISNMAVTLELDNLPDWNIFRHRKSLITVMKFLDDVGIIRTVEENSSFSEDKEAEGLYETTGLANFFTREFKGNIKDYTSIEDYLNDEFQNQDDNKGDIRRYKVYRHLLYSLVSYTSDLSEAEMDYLRKFRMSIKSELDKYVDAELELSRNMAVLLYDENTQAKYDYPNSKAISDIVLLVNDSLLKLVEEKDLNIDETFLLSKEEIARVIKTVREENEYYMSKLYRGMNFDTFLEEIISYMKEYDFLREEDNYYRIYPMIGKITGYLPKETMENNEQINLFGGSEIEEL